MKNIRLYIASGFVIFIGVFIILYLWLLLVGASFTKMISKEIMIASISLMGSIIGGIASGVLTLAGVILTVRHTREQIKDQAKLDEIRESGLILRKINIEKYQEVLGHLNEIYRLYALLFVAVREYIAREIDLENLRIKINDIENKIIDERNKINAMKVFVSELDVKIRNIENSEREMGDFILDHFTHPTKDGKPRIISIQENNLRRLNQSTLTLVSHEITRINGLLKGELDQLEIEKPN